MVLKNTDNTAAVLICLPGFQLNPYHNSEMIKIRSNEMGRIEVQVQIKIHLCTGITSNYSYMNQGIMIIVK